MRFKISSDHSPATIRLLVNFVAQELEISDYVSLVEVTKYRGSFRGRCWGRRVLLRVGPASSFPMVRHRYRVGAPEYDIMDWMEAFVVLAGHEFTHSRQFKAGVSRHSEVDAERGAHWALLRFRERRPEIEGRLACLASTSDDLAKARALKAEASCSIDARIASVEAKMARWEKKLKTASTYLKKYRAKLLRLERVRGKSAGAAAAAQG